MKLMPISRIPFFFHVLFLLILHLHLLGIVKIFPFVVRTILLSNSLPTRFHLDNHDGNIYLHSNGSLEIRKVQSTDNDQYLCTATNPAGTITYSVQLNVNSKETDEYVRFIFRFYSSSSTMDNWC